MERILNVLEMVIDRVIDYPPWTIGYAIKFVVGNLIYYVETFLYRNSV